MKDSGESFDCNEWLLFANGTDRRQNLVFWLIILSFAEPTDWDVEKFCVLLGKKGPRGGGREEEEEGVHDGTRRIGWPFDVFAAAYAFNDIVDDDEEEEDDRGGLGAVGAKDIGWLDLLLSLSDLGEAVKGGYFWPFGADSKGFVCLFFVLELEEEVTSSSGEKG